MKKVKKVIAFLILVLIINVISGCQQNLSEEEIKQKIIEANSNINSYNLDTSGTMNMAFVFFEQNINVEYVFAVNEKVNKINKKLYAMIDVNLKMNANSINSGKATPISSNQQTKIEAYVINDMIYTKTKGEWEKSRLQGDIWKNINQFSKTFDLLKKSNIEFLGEEEIDGVNYYKAKITPDNNDVSASYGQLNATVDEFSSTIWINKETFVIEKIKSIVKVSSNNAKVSNEAEPQPDEVVTNLAGELKVAYNIDVKLSNINGNVDVNLPPEALRGKEVKDRAIDPLMIL